MILQDGLVVPLFCQKLLILFTPLLWSYILPHPTFLVVPNLTSNIDPGVITVGLSFFFILLAQVALLYQTYQNTLTAEYRKRNFRNSAMLGVFLYILINILSCTSYLNMYFMTLGIHHHILDIVTIFMIPFVIIPMVIMDSFLLMNLLHQPAVIADREVHGLDAPRSIGIDMERIDHTF